MYLLVNTSKRFICKGAAVSRFHINRLDRGGLLKINCQPLKVNIFHPEQLSEHSAHINLSSIFNAVQLMPRQSGY